MRASLHFVCASLLCAQFEKDRRRRVLPLQEFEAEFFFNVLILFFACVRKVSLNCFKVPS